MTAPNTITFSDDTTEMMRISKDGVWVNPDVPVNDAAKVVIEALDQYMQQLQKRPQEPVAWMTTSHVAVGGLWEEQITLSLIDDGGEPLYKEKNT